MVFRAFCLGYNIEGMIRKRIALLLLSLVVISTIELVVQIIRHNKNERRSSSTLPVHPATPIPSSSVEAAQYIAQAAKLASNGDYPGAEKVLRNALTMFPSDVNLKLTLEYYENQDRQHPQ